MADDGANSKASLTLNIISPSNPPINFENLSLSTCVAELKQKICEASPTHPPVGSQRLIYRGHPLVQSERTLKDIVSPDVIGHSDPVTFHLVIPPTNTNPTPQTPTAPQAGSQLPTTQNMPQVHPTAQMTFSFQMPHHPIHANPVAQTQQNPNSQNAGQAQTNPQAVQQLQMQQIQQMNAIHAQAQAMMASQIAAMQQQQQQHPAYATHAPLPVLPMHHVPPPFTQQPAHPALPQQQPNPQGQAQTGQQGTGSITPHGHHHTTQAHESAQHVHQQVRHPWEQLAQGHGFRFPMNQTGPVNFQIPSQQFQRPSNVSLPTPTTSNVASTPSTQEGQITNTQHTVGSQPSAQPAVYLLSSPTGPQALLVSPSGLFSTPWVIPQAVPSFPTTEPHSSHTPSTFASRQSHAGPSTTSNPTSMSQPQSLQENEAGRAQIQPPPVIPANQQPRDLAGWVLQFSRQIWMLVRLLGCIYFFSAGASTTRTILLFAAATLVFFGQLGLFTGLWQAVRRRTDGLFPLGGNDQLLRAERRPENNPGSQGSTTPDQAAQRLLERPPQGGGAVRQALRRVERALALFFGSLAPGLAERHIQVRAEAEAARQREIREREVKEEHERTQEEARKSQAEGPTDKENVPEVRTPSEEGGSQGTAEAPLIEV